MDAVQLLIADHNRVRGLFKQAQSAHEADDTSKLTGGELVATVAPE